MDDARVTQDDLDKFRDIKPEMIDLKIPLVEKGMTRDLLAQGDHSTFRIHCYSPNQGEVHGLHAHIDEEHLFVILNGVVNFSSIDGELPQLGKYQALWLPKGCFYEFVNPGPDPPGGAALRRHPGKDDLGPTADAGRRAHRRARYPASGDEG